jgi:hypothetical protein
MEVAGDKLFRVPHVAPSLPHLVKALAGQGFTAS